MDDNDTVKHRYRAFVRSHHPDVGGDPETFTAGLAELRQAGRSRLALRVEAHRSPGLRRSLRRWWRRHRR